MDPLQNTVTWYKNTFLDNKRRRGTRKTKRLLHLKSYYPLLSRFDYIVSHLARCFLYHVTVFHIPLESRILQSLNGMWYKLISDCLVLGFWLNVVEYL